MSIRSLVAALTLGALASCGGELAAEPAEADASTTRDMLVIGTQSDIGVLNPVVQETAADDYVLQALSVRMTGLEFDCSLKKSPAYAKSWEWNDEGTVLKVELRDDLTWEDGTKVTAADVAFTYELVSDPVVASARLAFIERMNPDARPRVIDDTHIEWHFTNAYDRDTQMSHTSLPLVPKHVFADADRASLRGHERSNRPLSYGPWRLETWEPNQRLVLEPNEHFTGPEYMKPRLSRIVYRVIPEYSTRLIELETGGIDHMQSILVQDADRLREEHPEINLVRRGWRAMDYVAWNLKDPLFEDKAVRTALAMATDVDGMIGKLLTGKDGEKFARRATSTITPALCGVHNDDIAPIAHNADQAKQMLASAGWRDTNGDGVLDKDGKKFEFTLSTNTGNKRRADSAVLLQDQLKKVGVVVNIEKTESNAFFENLRKRDYQAALAGWVAGLFVDPTDIWHCEDDEHKYEFNFTSYCNPKVDELIEKGLNTPVPKDSAPLWQEVQQLVHDDQPYLFLWWMDEIVGISDRFENTKIDILSPLNDLHQWEVPEDKVKYRK